MQDQDQKLILVHKSANDYVADDRNIGLTIFPLGYGAAQKELAHLLIGITRSLRRDICGVENVRFCRKDIAGDAISSHLPGYA